MLEERNEILRAKQAALARLQEKKVREKTQAMMVYGLWQTKGTRNYKVQVKYIQVEGIKSPTRFQEKGFRAGVQ